MVGAVAPATPRRAVGVGRESGAARLALGDVRIQDERYREVWNVGRKI